MVAAAQHSNVIPAPRVPDRTLAEIGRDPGHKASALQRIEQLTHSSKLPVAAVIAGGLDEVVGFCAFFLGRADERAVCVVQSWWVISVGRCSRVAENRREPPLGRLRGSGAGKRQGPFIRLPYARDLR